MTASNDYVQNINMNTGVEATVVTVTEEAEVGGDVPGIGGGGLNLTAPVHPWHRRIFAKPPVGQVATSTLFRI